MDKIKAVNPNIIVRGNVNKPYYLIEYYDLSDNEWHIGYGSYCLANVKEWLKTYFEVTNVDVAPVKHIKNQATVFGETLCPNCGIHLDETSKIVTSEDGDVDYYQFQPKFCANCGARMDGDADANSNDGKTPET